MKTTAPISAVIATRHRAKSLSRTLDSLLEQDLLPAEFIVVDASGDDATKNLMSEFEKRVAPSALVRWAKADIAGAASQRNQGVACATQPFIWFFDDDVMFEPNCSERLWEAIESDRQLGGVNAMIVNQRYQSPGFVSRAMFTLMNGKPEETFAGRVIGPAINLLPEDREDLPEVVPVEWLNLGATIYRREALPHPPFDAVFKGYSLMEDLTLSLRVGKKWRLANVRKARIFHHSQATAEKGDHAEMAKMELINRHYVMTEILGRSKMSDLMKLALYEAFQLAASAYNRPRALPAVMKGQFGALTTLLRRDRKS
jgi:glycosyltransferase involved in cell wall biosynthesis